ncbi:MAG: hypothetical protein FJ267_19090, partial [Planctomycetes bacterium]|nr:hypothetical protein [Planctomycetota bacterium]
MSRTVKLRLAILGGVTFLSLVIYLLWWTVDPVPSARTLTFGISVYSGQRNPWGNVPINPFGEQDAEAFLSLNQSMPSQFPLVQQEKNSLQASRLLDFVRDQSESQDLTRMNLVLFGSLHGHVAATGFDSASARVQLFAIDATADSPDPGNAGSMLELNELVDLLEKSPARRVLLLLDASRLQSNWRMGILANEIADQLIQSHPRSQKVESPEGQAASSKRTGTRVSILISADSGQTSYHDGENSIFVNAVIDGLSGLADGWTLDGNLPRVTNQKDQRVTLRELEAFTNHFVSNWAKSHWGDH